MKSARCLYLVVLLFTAISIIFPVSSFAQKKPVRTFHRDQQTCPPGGLANMFQWDDGKGNDLTVEEICVNDSYFSLRISQSLNGRYTTVGTPTGTTGTATGEC